MLFCFSVLHSSALFARGRAGHAIAAFVLFRLNITTFPFAKESKTKAKAAISFYNQDVAVFQLHFGSLPKMGTQWHSLHAASHHYNSSEHNIPLHFVHPPFCAACRILIIKERR